MVREYTLLDYEQRELVRKCDRREGGVGEGRNARPRPS